MRRAQETAVPCYSAALRARQQRGKRALLQGASAEDSVERAYRARGCVLLAKRLRIGPGELDLVFLRNGLVVFVEVKSSRSHDRAIQSLSQAQLGRLMGAAECFLASRADLMKCDIRVDLASVDQTGRVRVVPNISL